MEYRRLGSSGLKLSALSLGTWVTFGSQLDEQKAEKSIRTAFDAGVNFFDSAEVYGAGRAEEILGTVLAKIGLARSEFVVSTKIFWGGKLPNQRGLSRKHIIEGTEAALKRLRLDHVDLVFCHRPDQHTPIEETVRAMTFLINQGKALYWGTSEWSAAQLMQAYGIARQEHLIPPQMEQPQYHMFHRERVEKEYADLYSEIGLGTTIWSPLAGGILSGKYSDGIPEGSRPTLPGYEWLRARYESDEAKERIAKVKDITAIATELDCSMAQLALAWCLRNPNVSTVITGASNIEQLNQNIAALDLVDKLTPEVLERIDDLLGNAPSPETDWRDY